jgi:hypothetical protein
MIGAFLWFGYLGNFLSIILGLPLSKKIFSRKLSFEMKDSDVQKFSFNQTSLDLNVKELTKLDSNPFKNVILIPEKSCIRLILQHCYVRRYNHV